MPSQTNKVMSIHSNKEFKPQNLSHTSKSSDNSGGGEPPMDKYVTHEELELSKEKLSHQIDNRFSEVDKRLNDIELKMNKQFNDAELKTDKRFNDLELKMNDIKNTANSNKEKINWLLYTAVGGIVISVLTTIITNLLTK